jgi:hypothetical protein
MNGAMTDTFLAILAAGGIIALHALYFECVDWWRSRRERQRAAYWDWMAATRHARWNEPLADDGHAQTVEDLFEDQSVTMQGGET